MSAPRIALIGLGEVGAILAQDLRDRAETLSAFDLKAGEPASIPVSNARRLGLEFSPGAQEAVRGADLVICAVTAAQTQAAAQSTITGLRPGAVYLDLNSASPGVRSEAARMVSAVSGCYVEAAVMSPFPPKRLASPILLGGPHAAQALPMLKALGFAGASVFAAEYGKASAAKLCRSVMVKGIEALLSESLLAARAYGVDDTVIASLGDLFPGPDWRSLAHYMMSRTLEHGSRRAEEMREAVRCVSEAGVAPWMASATVERQALAPSWASALPQREIAALLDAIRAQRKDGETPA